MKILVIGNGFDIEHNLPTSYRDFLNFCNSILELNGLSSMSGLDKLKSSQKKYIEKIKTNKPLEDKFLELLKDNYLLNYFNRQAEKENWVDLEGFLDEIVTALSHIEKQLSTVEETMYIVNTDHRIYQIIEELGLTKMCGNCFNKIKLNAIHETLCVCLDRFSIALELYICKFVNSTSLDGIAPDIIEFDATNVLVFNYSNTYERMYGGVHWNEAISYIHGMARNNGNKNSNIILGITSLQAQAEKKVHYVEFEKYFQRITKKTGSEYKKWLLSGEQENQEIEIAFFGHSLDSTDGDVIEDFLECKKAKITIFYHDTDAYQRIVSNLNSIIGKKELIKAVSGENPKITFKQQSKHQKVTTGGVEITRDIRKIYQLHSLSNSRIKKLLDKIYNKIQEKDLHYFYSQRKAISLFDALIYQQIEDISIKDYLDVCKEMDYEIKNGKLVYYQSEEWDDYSIQGKEPCDVQTKKLINAINKSNEKKVNEQMQENTFLVLGELKTKDEIKSKLIEILGEIRPNKLYWKKLREMITTLKNHTMFSNALKELYRSSRTFALPTRVKIKYLYQMYDEYCFERDMMEQRINRKDSFE